MNFRKGLSKLAKWSLVILVGAVFVLTGQLSQYSTSLDSARRHTVSEWHKQNPQDARVAEQFVRECLERPPESRTEDIEALQHEQFLTVEIIYDCGEKLGGHGLVALLKETDEAMSSLSWPLSVLVHE
ncbi:hypothetical protein [Enterovibrio norvegicus]|uniref:hypothetical protein n=1 Tax=Enterovibrio norvegicus TaxID=188144 RepID=UPI00352EDA4A